MMVSRNEIIKLLFGSEVDEVITKVVSLVENDGNSVAEVTKGKVKEILLGFLLPTEGEVNKKGAV
jgi:hypothetical protein